MEATGSDLISNFIGVEEGKKEKTDCNYSRKNDDFLLRTMGGFRDELSC